MIMGNRAVSDLSPPCIPPDKPCSQRIAHMGVAKMSHKPGPGERNITKVKHRNAREQYPTSALGNVML